MIYLIVGQPRSGKSQYAVHLALELEKANVQIEKKTLSGNAIDDKKEVVRKIYTDIDGFDYFEKSPADWRDAGKDAIIFYDEVHYRKEFLDQSKYMSQNSMIIDLSIHGHSNVDIYLITQDPRRLEKSIRALISKMYLVKRPANMPPFATIYTFDRWLGDPWSACKNTDRVHDQKIFHYKKDYFNMYKSASAHTSVSFKLQNRFKVVIVSAIVLIFLSVVFFRMSGIASIVKSEQTSDENTANKDVEKKPKNQNITSETQVKEKPKTASNYDENQRIAMIVESTNDCYAKNSFGEIIEMSDSECRFLSKNNKRMSMSRIKPELKNDDALVLDQQSSKE